MKTSKRGQSQTITVVLLILCVIVSIVIVYSITNYFIKKTEENKRIKIVTTNLELDKSLIILEKDNGKLQLNIKRYDEINNLSLIKAVVLGSLNSGSYLIFNVQNVSFPKTYVLNISNVGDIREILIYPLVYTPFKTKSQSDVLTKTSKENIKEVLIYPVYGRERIEYYGELDFIQSNAKIDPNLDVVDPEQGEIILDCISDWDCEEWSSCHTIYTLNNIISNEVVLFGEQTRLCKDNNKCISYIIDRKECDSKGFVTIKKTEINNTQYIEIFDENNTMVTKLEFIKGEHSVLNIEIPII